MRPVLPPPVRPDSRRRRPRLLALQVLPTLVTLGNVLAGFLALSYVVDAASGAAPRETLWLKAAGAIFFGMVCDALDGRVARLTGAASAFGAELDSLADMITFGVAPALLAKAVVDAHFPGLPPRVTTVLAMVYVLGAALRLARYNVESQRVQEPGHVTRTFRGLPSPGAAGMVASLVLFRHEFAAWDLRWLPWVFLVGTPVAGLLMVSRFAFPHVMNRYLTGARSPFTILVLVVLLFLTIQHWEASLAGLFWAYAATGPVTAGVRALFRRGRPDADEDDDEDLPVPGEADDVGRS